MNKIIIVLILLVFTVPTFAEETEIIKKKVTNLNEASIESLGVSLNALIYLVDASPNTYHTYDMLDKRELESIRELEKQGYVRTEIVLGLPNGKEKNSKFLRILPLKKGASLRVAIGSLISSNLIQ